MFILLLILFIAGIVQGRRSAKTPKRGTREGVRAIHGMRRKEHVVDYAGMYFIGVPSE
jgi:hypothetical protein